MAAAFGPAAAARAIRRAAQHQQHQSRSVVLQQRWRHQLQVAGCRPRLQHHHEHPWSLQQPHRSIASSTFTSSSSLLQRHRSLHSSRCSRDAPPKEPPSSAPKAGSATSSGARSSEAPTGAAAAGAAKEAKPEGAGGGDQPARSLEHLTEMYSDMEAKLMARMRTHNKGRFRTAAIVTVLTVIWVFNTFGKEIRVWMGGQTAEVARETLKHEAIQIQTQELAMAVVNTLLNDPKVLAATSVFLQDAASDPDTQAAIVSLASHVLQHPDTLQEVHALAQKLIAQLVKDPLVIHNVSDLAVSVLADSKTKAGFVKLVAALTQDEEVYAAFLDMVSRIIAEPRVKEQVSLIMADGSHHVLADADVLQHGKDFVAEVMGDDQVQKTGGDALWHSVQYALRWRLMVVAGLSMACAGAIFAGRGWR